MKIKTTGLRYGALAALIASSVTWGWAHAGQNAITVSVGGSIGGGSCTASADAVNLGNKSFTDFSGGSIDVGPINFNINCPLGTTYLIRGSGMYYSQMLTFGSTTLIFGPSMNPLYMGMPKLAGVPISTNNVAQVYNGIGTGANQTLALTGMVLQPSMNTAPTNGPQTAVSSGMFVLVY
jgi:hypothetical protein